MKQNEPTGSTPVSSPVRKLDAVVIGAGFAGLYMLHRLRKMGLSTRAYEAGSDIGGTWFWNRYPGASCDVESVEYSYSFSEELQQEWTWPERYASQPEILRYIHFVADKFDLRRDIQLNTRVESAQFDEKTDLWMVTTDGGERIQARFCIMATGCLSAAKVPEIQGLERFKGEWYHTGRWPHEGVDFTGLRVGVIGTGSSGIQLIPHVAQQAAQLYVFQRTANFCVPAHNRKIDPEQGREHKKSYPAKRREALATPFCMAGHPPPAKRALEATAEERQQTYEKKWATGGAISFLYSYKDLLVDKQANETASEFVRQKIRHIVRDPATAELLCPDDHYIGTKRLCLGNNYFDTYNRENVRLVNVRQSPIRSITEDGLRTESEDYKLDAIVFATGFDAMTGALFDINIRGKGGLPLTDKWAEGPRTYLGLMTANFPNMFIITGPGSPSVKTNMVCAIEQHVDWIADCLQHLRAQQVSRIEADPAFEANWVAHVNEVGDSTLYPLANSWYVGANIPGKPRVFTPYVAGLDVYRRKCDEVAAKGYEGFILACEEVPA
jgi:cyclohexanone monooxygenase